MSKAELNGQNVYGDVFVPRDAMIEAMTKVGLTLEEANMRVRSSAVRFVGKIDGIEVSLSTNIMIRTSPLDAFLETRFYKVMPMKHSEWGYALSNDPVKGIGSTHFKLSGWVPENVTLRGTGRDKVAWKIFEMIANAINERTRFSETSNESIIVEVAK